MSGKEGSEEQESSIKEEFLDNLDAIKTLSSLLNSLIEKAKENVEESLEDFVSDKVRQLAPATGGYFKCFSSFGVKTRAALEAKWSKFYQDREVREAVEGLLEAEDNWNGFLREVDSMVYGGAASEVVTVGCDAPCQLQSRKDDFEKAGTKIVIVSFGSEEKATVWVSDTNCQFPMLVDADSTLYKALGLGSSVAKVWAISSLAYYSEKKLAGRKLISMLEEDDPHQLGGDFIIDRTGKLVLVYQSKMSTDRPSVEYLLGFLKTDLPSGLRLN